MSVPAGTILAMDTGAPELVLGHIEPVGRAVEYYTDVGHVGGRVHYDLRDVSKFAPPGANAFLLESAEFADEGRQLLLRFRYFHVYRRGGRPS